MNAIEVMKLVRTAPPGRTGLPNTSSQDSASLHPPPHGRRPVRGDPGLGYSRRVPPGRLCAFDLIGSAFDLFAGGKGLVVTIESVHAIARPQC